MSATEVRLNAGDFLPGDVAEGPVPHASSSQAGLAAVKYGPKIPSAPRPFQVGDRYRFTNDVVQITEVIPALDFYDGEPAVRYAWLTEIDVDPAIREHSPREAGRLTGLARAEVFARTATFVEPAPTDPSGGAVTAPTPAPSDDTTATIVSAALRWHAIHNANAEDVPPLQLFDADDALHTAVTAHIAAVIS